MSHSVSPFLTVCDVGLAPCASAELESPSPTESASRNRRDRLEREIVVLGIKGRREIGERLVLGSRLRGRARPRRRLRRGVGLAAITLAGQKNQLATVDLSRVPGLAILVLPGPVHD